MNPSRAGFLSCPKTGTIPVTSTGGFTSLPRPHGHGLWPRCPYPDAHPPRRAREVFISKRERTPSEAPNSDLCCWGGQEEPEACRGLFLIVRCLWPVGAQWPFSFLKGLFTFRASVHSVRCPINRGRETVACQAQSQVWWLWPHVIGGSQLPSVCLSRAASRPQECVLPVRVWISEPAGGGCGYQQGRAGCFDVINWWQCQP